MADQPILIPEDFQFVPVASSNLAAIAYDDLARRLFVRFKSGWLYRYDGVPKGKYTAFLGAESKGKFLHQFIKNVYPYTRLA